MEPDDETGFPDDPSRARRAMAIGALSLLAVAVACVAYLHPAAQSPTPAPTPSAGYQLDAVDFIDPSAGWILADRGTSDFAVLSTADAGRSWTERLVSSSTGHGEYMRLFSRSAGVVVVVGAQAEVFATGDGGAHWTKRPVAPASAYVVSASFVDPLHGWLLEFGTGSDGLSSTVLAQTEDGGVTWDDLGSPASVPAEAFAVSFTDMSTGWLDAVASGPYAYTTADGGATWRQVALPPPATGWPVPHGWFFVAARPTLGNGVIVTVVNSTHINGRSAAGSAVLSYPPLTVRAFDGGSAVTYVYSTLVDSASDGVLHIVDANHRPGPSTQAQPADQIGLRSMDGGATWHSFAPPAPGGTIGYADAATWWWIGPRLRAWSSDGGVTWSPSLPDAVAEPLPGTLIVLDSKHGWVSGLLDSGPALFTTSDGGDHWTSVGLPQAFT